MIKRFLPCALAILLAAPDAALAHGFEKQVQELDDSEPAIVANARTYTVGDLKSLVALRANPGSDGFYFFSVEDLLDAGRLAPAYEILAKEARAEGIELTEQDRVHAEEFLRGHVERQLFSRWIASERDQPTSETLLGLYEAQKNRRFFLPERVVIRQLYFRATDNSAGDVEAEAAWKRLQSGTQFSDIQREFPLDEKRPFATELVELDALERENPEFAEILKSLGDQEYSRPFLFGEGYSIVQRQVHIPRAFIPIESVSQILRDESINEQDTRLMREFFMRVARESRLIRIYPQNLANAGALALDSDLLLSIGERDFTRGELRGIMGWQLAPDVPHNERTFAELALMTGPVQQALIDYLIASQNLMNGEDVVALRKLAEETALVRHLLHKRFFAELQEPSESEIDARAVEQGIELTDEARQNVREELIEERRAEFERELLKRTAVGIEVEPLIRPDAGS